MNRRDWLTTGVGRGYSRDTCTANPHSPVVGVHSAPSAKKASVVFSACPKLSRQQDYRVVNERINERSFDITKSLLRLNMPIFEHAQLSLTAEIVSRHLAGVMNVRISPPQTAYRTVKSGCGSNLGQAV